MGELIILPNTTPGRHCGCDGARVTVPRGATIFCQDEDSDAWFEIESGVVRTSHLNRDGRRQLTGFFFDGDALGVEGGARHRVTAEAVTETVLVRWPRRRLEAAAEDDLSAHARLRDMLGRALAAAEARILLFGLRTAAERLAGFLLWTERREAGAGRVRLPMSRYDIADYLGLTVETVSRTFTEFTRNCWIALNGPHDVAIVNRQMLADLADGALPDDEAGPAPRVPAAALRKSAPRSFAAHS